MTKINKYQHITKDGIVKNNPVSSKYYDTRNVAKELREIFKREFPGFKFSVVNESYSGGSSINISLMESPKGVRIIKRFEDLTENEVSRILRQNPYRSKEDMIKQIKEVQNSKHHQLNEYQLRDEYNENSSWNNGVFLTEQGFYLFKAVATLVNRYNWDKSDSMVDYFDVNFYLHLNIGKWDRPYVGE